MNENTILNMIENSALPPKGAGFAGVMERINAERERGTLYQPVPEVPMAHGSIVKKAVKGTLITAAALTLVAGAGAALSFMGGAKSESDCAAPEMDWDVNGSVADSSESYKPLEDSMPAEVSDSDVSSSDEQAADDEENNNDD